MKYARLGHRPRYIKAARTDGSQVDEHVLVAERALGGRLPAGALVHHVDYDTTNNHPSNLVVCEDAHYHWLLHQRTDALRATGDASKRKCQFCGGYDDVANLRFERSSNPRHRGPARAFHPACGARRQREYRAKRTAMGNPVR